MTGFIITIAILSIVIMIVKESFKKQEEEKEQKRQELLNKKSIDTSFEKSISNVGFYLFLDIETTGLPTYAFKNNISLKESQYWPRIAQFCWIILDCDFKLVKRKCCYVNFGGSMPYDATKINGITTEILQQEGVPTTKVLTEFLDDLDTVKIVIAHNTNFDLSIIQSEIYRHKLKNKLYRFPSYCTMINTTNICKVEKKMYGGGYKWPTLKELYTYCFFPNRYNITIDGEHNAEIDTAMTIRSLHYLLKEEKIKQMDIFLIIRHYQKDESELASILDDHIYILNKLKNFNNKEEVKKISIIKLVNKKFIPLQETNSLFFERRIIKKINWYKEKYII